MQASQNLPLLLTKAGLYGSSSKVVKLPVSLPKPTVLTAGCEDPMLDLKHKLSFNILK